MVGATKSIHKGTIKPYDWNVQIKALLVSDENKVK
jgi:hypothetical protein